MLEVGMKAPDFTLKNQKDEEVKLSSFLGKKVILYFYPKDSTPGCTKEACSFRDFHSDFVKNDYVVLGVSKDSVKSHVNFSTKYELPFDILSDTQLEVCNAYDVYKEKKLYGKVSMGVVRTTYIIDENGVIEYVFKKVDTANHATEVLNVLQNK